MLCGHMKLQYKQRVAIFSSVPVFYRRMEFCLFFLVIALSSQAVSAQTCPSDHFSAVFTATVDTISTGIPSFGPDDPELYFFREKLGFREADIKHTTEDAITFFNYTFGLDFSAEPNEMNERFFENTRMAPYVLSNEHKMYANTNNWIRTGSTRTISNRSGRFPSYFLRCPDPIWELWWS